MRLANTGKSNPELLMNLCQRQWSRKSARGNHTAELVAQTVAAEALDPEVILDLL